MTNNSSAAELYGQLDSIVANLQLGKIDEARMLCVALLSRWPNQADALHYLGICFYEQGELPSAVRHLKNAVLHAPSVPEFRFNLGNALLRSGDTTGALAAYREAIALDPNFSPAIRSAAEILSSEKSNQLAGTLFEQWGCLEPSSCEAWSKAGEAWLGAGNYEKAITAMQRAVALDENSCKLWNNLGVAYSQRGLLRLGCNAFKRAVSLDPAHVRALGNYANALRDSGRVEEALQVFSIAIQKAPNDALIHSNALFTLLFSHQTSIDAVATAHCQFGDQLDAASRTVSAVSKDHCWSASKKIRVAYLSPDFRNHPVSSFIAGILKYHDPKKFEVFLYSCGVRSDEYTQSIKASAAHWRDVSLLSDEALLRQAEVDQLDILVDLAGHTAHNRMPAVANRLAAVQVHYLGYPFTTGIAAMDYRITDAVVDPHGAERLASEKLIRLSRSYYAFTPPAGAPEVSPSPMQIRGFPTFGVCSNLAKVSPLTLDRWASLLNGVPASRFLWRAKAFDDFEIADTMREELVRRGVNGDRIEMCGWASDETRWHLFSKIDLALDTFPYNQATNTCEALWMGVPTLTILGFSHQSRMGGSIMKAARLPQFVVDHAENWLGTARAILESGALPELRQTMREKLTRTELLDVGGLTLEIERNFETLLKDRNSRINAPA